MNKLLISLLVIIILIGGFFVFSRKPDYKNISYKIEGQLIQLKNGEAEDGNTRYFGNEFRTDLNNDGTEDVVFLITREPGGSGTFFYVVAAVATKDGYKGSDAFLLGDRIAPQSIGLSPNPRHKQVIVINYTDRAPGEPMTTPPSVGKSAWIKLDPETMQFGIVVPDFEGESR